MHEHHWLSEGLARQELESAIDQRTVRFAGRLLQMAIEEPRRHQRQFPLQRLGVIRLEQPRRLCASDLDAAQSLRRITVQGVRVRAGPQLRQIRGRAEVFQQHQPAGTVGRLDVRHVYAASLEERRDLQERAHVLLVGRRIHHDAGLAVRTPAAEVTPEAGVGGGGLEPLDGKPKLRGQPGAKKRYALVSVCQLHR